MTADQGHDVGCLARIDQRAPANLKSVPHEHAENDNRDHASEPGFSPRLHSVHAGPLKRLNDERQAEQHQCDRPESEQLAGRHELQSIEDERCSQQNQTNAKGEIGCDPYARFVDCHDASSNERILSAVRVSMCRFSVNGRKLPANVRCPL
jgi:hypothetical protein